MVERATKTLAREAKCESAVSFRAAFFLGFSCLFVLFTFAPVCSAFFLLLSARSNRAFYFGIKKKKT